MNKVATFVLVILLISNIANAQLYDVFAFKVDSVENLKFSKMKVKPTMHFINNLSKENGYELSINKQGDIKKGEITYNQMTVEFEFNIKDVNIKVGGSSDTISNFAIGFSCKNDGECVKECRSGNYTLHKGIIISLQKNIQNNFAKDLKDSIELTAALKHFQHLKMKIKE